MIELTPANLIQIVFSVQAVFFALIAFKQNLKIFALLLVIFAAHMLFNFFIELGISAHIPNITSAFGFAYGPLFYLYLKEITQSDFKMDVSLIPHAIPFIVAMPFSPGGVIFNIIFFLWTLYYVGKIVFYLQKYNRTIKDSISDVISARLSWLNKIFLFVLFVFIYDTCRSLLSQYGDMMNASLYYLITLLAAFIIISALAIFSLQFKQRFDGVLNSELSADSQDLIPEKMTEEQKQFVMNALDTLQKEQLYLDPKLRLSDFAEAVNIDQRELSRQLYQATGQRFSKHTMILRVEHAKKLIDQSLEDSKPINLLSLSYRSGFNAKSSFNLAFKQTTKMTPSEYINKQKI